LAWNPLRDVGNDGQVKTGRGFKENIELNHIPLQGNSAGSPSRKVRLIFNEPEHKSQNIRRPGLRLWRAASGRNLARHF